MADNPDFKLFDGFQRIKHFALRRLRLAPGSFSAGRRINDEGDALQIFPCLCVILQGGDNCI